jgi:hypothetical protein
MAAPAPAKFRIDVHIHNLLMKPDPSGPRPEEVKGTSLADAVFPLHPELLNDSRPGDPSGRPRLDVPTSMAKVRGWLLPYLRSHLARSVLGQTPYANR